MFQNFLLHISKLIRKGETTKFYKNFFKMLSLSLSEKTHPAVVRAVTACQEVRVQVELDPLGRDADVGVFYVVRIGPVNGIHTGYRHILLTIRQVFNVAKGLQQNKVIFRE